MTMTDPGGEIRAAIGLLYPGQEPDATPAGRLAALGLDTCLVYAELYDLLTDPHATDVAQRASDLAGELVDLHKRTERAVVTQFRGRWGW